jgi:hypothetical protein
VKSVIVLGRLGALLPAAQKAGVERVVLLSTAGGDVRSCGWRKGLLCSEVLGMRQKSASTVPVDSLHVRWLLLRCLDSRSLMAYLAAAGVIGAHRPFPHLTTTPHPRAVSCVVAHGLQACLNQGAWQACSRMQQMLG